MADLTITAYAQLSKNSLSKTMKTVAGITINYVPAASGPQAISTNWGQIGFGGITSPGYFSYLNLDGSNYVEFSANPDGSCKLAKCSPAMPGMFELANGFSLYARAVGGIVNLDYILFST